MNTFGFTCKVAEIVYHHWFDPEHLDMDAMNMMDFVYSLYRESNQKKLNYDEKWIGAEDVDPESEYEYYRSFYKKNKRQCMESDVQMYSNSYKKSVIEL